MKLYQSIAAGKQLSPTLTNLENASVLKSLTSNLIQLAKDPSELNAGDLETIQRQIKIAEKEMIHNSKNGLFDEQYTFIRELAEKKEKIDFSKSLNEVFTELSNDSDSRLFQEIGFLTEFDELFKTIPSVQLEILNDQVILKPDGESQIHLTQVSDHPELESWLEEGFVFANLSDDVGVVSTSLSDTIFSTLNELKHEISHRQSIQNETNGLITYGGAISAAITALIWIVIALVFALSIALILVCATGPAGSCIAIMVLLAIATLGLGALMASNQTTTSKKSPLIVGGKPISKVRIVPLYTEHVY